MPTTDELVKLNGRALLDEFGVFTTPAVGEKVIRLARTVLVDLGRDLGRDVEIPAPAVSLLGEACAIIVLMEGGAGRTGREIWEDREQVDDESRAGLATRIGAEEADRVLETMARIGESVWRAVGDNVVLEHAALVMSEFIARVAAETSEAVKADSCQ